MSEPAWIERDVTELREDYAAGRIELSELEDGLDDVFGVNGGSGHAKDCMINLPSGTCTCPREKQKPVCPRAHKPWRAWIEGREYCYSCQEWEPSYD
jgi:hypothetical protein